MTLANPDPDICSVCKHMKLEHGGKLTTLAKTIPGGSKFMDKLREERIRGAIPSPNNVYGCMVTDCMCKRFRN